MIQRSPIAHAVILLATACVTACQSLPYEERMDAKSILDARVIAICETQSSLSLNVELTNKSSEKVSGVVVHDDPWWTDTFIAPGYALAYADTDGDRLRGCTRDGAHRISLAPGETATFPVSFALHPQHPCHARLIIRFLSTDGGTLKNEVECPFYIPSSR